MPPPAGHRAFLLACMTAALAVVTPSKTSFLERVQQHEMSRRRVTGRPDPSAFFKDVIRRQRAWVEGQTDDQARLQRPIMIPFTLRNAFMAAVASGQRGAPPDAAYPPLTHQVEEHDLGQRRQREPLRQRGQHVQRQRPGHRVHVSFSVTQTDDCGCGGDGGDSGQTDWRTASFLTDQLVDLSEDMLVELYLPLLDDVSSASPPAAADAAAVSLAPAAAASPPTTAQLACCQMGGASTRSLQTPLRLKPGRRGDELSWLRALVGDAVMTLAPRADECLQLWLPGHQLSMDPARPAELAVRPYLQPPADDAGSPS